MTKFNHSEKLSKVLMMVIVGRTNAGKTHLLFTMLTTPGILDYNNLIIYTTTPEQPYYQFLYHGFKNNLTKDEIYALWNAFYGDDQDDPDDTIEEICRSYAKANMTGAREQQVVVTLSKNPSDIKDPSELARNKKNLIIFDDCVNNKDQSIQQMYFTRGRHNSCACIYLTQSFYGLDGQYIRKNANIFILFPITDRNLLQLQQDVDVGDKEVFKALCRLQFNNPGEHKYILINTDKPRNMRVVKSVFKNGDC